MFLLKKLLQRFKSRQASFSINNIIITQQMSINKNWLPHVQKGIFQQDRALIHLFCDRKVAKWTKISQLLAEQFFITGKSPKKCRERFNNHLNPAILRGEWTPDEEVTLMRLHSQLGNRWAEISRHLSGRTENSVKNKLYSKFRKALRNINFLLATCGHFKNKEIKIGFIYKIMNIFDRGLQSDGNDSNDLCSLAKLIKEEIIEFQEDCDTEGANSMMIQEKLTKLMDNVHSINISFKRKVGKKKGSKYSIERFKMITDLQVPLLDLKMEEKISSPTFDQQMQREVDASVFCPPFHQNPQVGMLKVKDQQQLLGYYWPEQYNEQLFWQGNEIQSYSF